MPQGGKPKGEPSFLEVLSRDDDSGRKCDLSRALIRMDPAMADQVKEAMANEAINAAAIARTLQRFEYPVSEGSVRRCRRICDCWRKGDDD